MDTAAKSSEQDRELGWGAISNIISEAAEIAESKHRDDIVEMLSDTFDAFEKVKEPEKLFLDCYQFAFRIRYRIPKLDSSIALNRITKDGNGFVITNYSYKMFLWAKAHGLEERMDNLCIYVPEEKLTPSEIKNFESKVKKV